MWIVDREILIVLSVISVKTLMRTTTKKKEYAKRVLMEKRTAKKTMSIVLILSRQVVVVRSVRRGSGEIKSNKAVHMVIQNMK